MHLSKHICVSLQIVKHGTSDKLPDKNIHRVQVYYCITTITFIMFWFKNKMSLAVHWVQGYPGLSSWLKRLSGRREKSFSGISRKLDFSWCMKPQGSWCSENRIIEANKHWDLKSLTDWTYQPCTPSLSLPFQTSIGTYTISDFRKSPIVI